MNENVESLILTHLRENRSDMIALRNGVAPMKTDLADVDRKVGGLAILLTMLAGHVQHIEERAEALESRT